VLVGKLGYYLYNGKGKIWVFMQPMKTRKVFVSYRGKKIPDWPQPTITFWENQWKIGRDLSEFFWKRIFL